MQNSVVQWLEGTAIRFPDNIAFVDENHQYTWSELRHTALSIASSIKRVLSGRKHPIAVYMEKSADMVAAYMGIAYSGNFYSPIAVDMPSARAEKIIQTLRPSLFITTKDLKDSMGAEKMMGGGVSIL